MVITSLCEPWIEGCFLHWMQNNMCDTQWSEFKKLEQVYTFYNYCSTHKSEEASVGSGTHVANDRSSFTSPETDNTSNVSQVARKQRVDCRQIIHADQSSSFEPILRQNFHDGDKVRFDPPRVRWSWVLLANPESRVVSSVGCRITCATPSEANLRN
jgi:hypothetical protein